MKIVKIFPLLLLAFLASCTFSKRRSSISLKSIPAGKKIHYTSVDSFYFAFKRSDFLDFLQKDTITSNYVAQIDSMFASDNVSLDSIYDTRRHVSWHLVSENFIVSQFDKGNAEITNLRTGNKIKRLKSIKSYYRKTRFAKKELVGAAYISTEGEVYCVRFIFIHF